MHEKEISVSLDIMAKEGGSWLSTILVVIGIIVVGMLIFGVLGAVLEFLINVPFWVWIIVVVLYFVIRDN